MRSASRVTCVFLCMIVLSSLEGCGNRGRGGSYDVAVFNSTDALIKDASVSLNDGAWKFDFGLVGENVDASYGGDGSLPAQPVRATVSWTDSLRKTHVAHVDIKPVATSPSKKHTLVFDIQDEGRVTAKFIER